jgi:hypothetical protein
MPPRCESASGRGNEADDRFANVIDSFGEADPAESEGDPDSEGRREDS